MELSRTPHALAAVAAALAMAFFAATAIPVAAASGSPAGGSKSAASSPGPKASKGGRAKASANDHSVRTTPGRKIRAGARARNVVQPAPVVVPIVDERAVSRDIGAVVREFDRWLDGIEASGDVAGLATAIVKDDRVVLERGIGFGNWDTQEPVDGDTVFRVASLSKAFAAAVAGKLVEEGRLGWGTRAADLLPTFTLSDVGDSGRLTVRDILSHRVGLPHNTYDRLLEQDEPYELLVGRLHEVPLTCPVGDCYSYQNIAFSLIGDLTYATTGDFFSHQVEKRLFHPLRMNTATYGRAALESSPKWARPHRRGNGGWIPFLPNENYYRVAPAAGVNASVRDMEQWLIAQMGGRPQVLSQELLDVLHAPLVETERETRSSPWRRGRLNDARYALGWRIYDYAGRTLVFHAGAVQGYRAMIAFLPGDRFGVVMLWNSESALPSGLLPMLLDRYLGLPEVNWAGLDEGEGPDRTGG
jgi:beta-lactamase class C